RSTSRGKADAPLEAHPSGALPLVAFRERSAERVSIDRLFVVKQRGKRRPSRGRNRTKACNDVRLGVIRLEDRQQTGNREHLSYTAGQAQQFQRTSLPLRGDVRLHNRAHTARVDTWNFCEIENNLLASFRQQPAHGIGEPCVSLYFDRQPSSDFQDRCRAGPSFFAIHRVATSSGFPVTATRLAGGSIVRPDIGLKGTNGEEASAKQSYSFRPPDRLFVERIVSNLCTNSKRFSRRRRCWHTMPPR